MTDDLKPENQEYKGTSRLRNTFGNAGMAATVGAVVGAGVGALRGRTGTAAAAGAGIGAAAGAATGAAWTALVGTDAKAGKEQHEQLTNSQRKINSSNC